jgi:hypothetical protein
MNEKNIQITVTTKKYGVIDFIGFEGQQFRNLE